MFIQYYSRTENAIGQTFVEIGAPIDLWASLGIIAMSSDEFPGLTIFQVSPPSLVPPPEPEPPDPPTEPEVPPTEPPVDPPVEPPA